MKLKNEHYYQGFLEGEIAAFNDRKNGIFMRPMPDTETDKGRGFVDAYYPRTEAWIDTMTVRGPGG